MNINLTIEFSDEDKKIFSAMSDMLDKLQYAYRAAGYGETADNIQDVMRALRSVQNSKVKTE